MPSASAGTRASLKSLMHHCTSPMAVLMIWPTALQADDRRLCRRRPAGKSVEMHVPKELVALPVGDT